MIPPNIKLSKFLFNAVLVLSLIAPIIIYLVYKGIADKCSGKIELVKDNKDKNTDTKKTIRNIILIAVLAGLAAQAMNYSYSYMRLRPSTP